MEKAPKEMLKSYVDSQKFSSTTEIMEAMKEMFRDVLQQVMESEPDAELGYEKIQRMSETAEEGKLRNYRNRYSKKTVKPQLGAAEVSRCRIFTFQDVHAVVVGGGISCMRTYPAK